MADGILFEKRNIQAASIVTSSFKASGDAMAKRMGFPAYRYAVIRHPLGSLKPPETEQRAKDVFEDIVSILGLTEKAPIPSPHVNAG